MAGKRIREQFIRQLTSLGLEDIFDEIMDIFFFAKNIESRFVMGNTATVKAFGFKTYEDLIGKSDFDDDSTEISNQYRQADQQVINTGHRQ